jgi:hypothetical protein
MLATLRNLLRTGAPKSKNTSRRNLRKLAAAETLERRELMAVTGVTIGGGTLAIQTDNYSTSVQVTQSGDRVYVKDVAANRSWYAPVSSVSLVEFKGGAGHDTFQSYVAGVPVRAYGNGGNDTLLGNTGADVLFGGPGNDRLIANSGNDQLIGGDGHDQLYGGNDNDKLWGEYGNDLLYGQNGDDHLMGDAGNDQLDGGAGNDGLWGGFGNDLLLGGDGSDEVYGNEGDDQLNGGFGADALMGGAGNDVMIAIDSGAADRLWGESGRDTYWVDNNTQNWDGVYGATADEKIQWVSGFANGADRTLNGDRVFDPAVKFGHTYRTFANKPLFSSSGPTVSDIRQQELGDCYFMAGLGAIAQANPNALRQNVVDFNDGTYGVRLGDKFYRVDNDLPVASISSTTPAYAGLGQQNSMWAAVVEKAFAHYRTGANSYTSIEGGFGQEIMRALGDPAASMRFIANTYASAVAMAADFAARLSRGEALTFGTGDRYLGVVKHTGAPLVFSHEYTVVRVVRNAWGTITGITLRNPWGHNGSPNDGTGGLVTLTPQQLFSFNYGNVSSGRV